MIKNPKGKCCKCHKKKGEVSLFSFPKNKVEALKWTTNLEVENSVIDFGCVVCELHFISSSFSKNTKKRKSLMENAIPIKMSKVNQPINL